MSETTLVKEVARRRTFAIISHPDAGKTTLTEQLLLTGGAVRMAGAVRAKGEARRTKSDWMKIEQMRGISVTSSVMTFERDGIIFNLLDTPGHEDFSEDTYRTLTAVDSAIMVIDAAKGIESQTLKLFEVCRLRDIPIITFINKVDREGRDPFELIDEIQDKLALDASPFVWPMGMGTDFHGCYDLRNNVYLSAKDGKQCDNFTNCSGLDDQVLVESVPEYVLASAKENSELAVDAYSNFDNESYLAGHLTPIIFGSALRGFGTNILIDFIGKHSPAPRSAPSESRVVNPNDKQVSGFVFKIQANMDVNHRDRIAFMRICSGEFKRGMKLKQSRTGKDIMIHSPILFMAQEREITENAYSGDIIGIPNHGTVRVGDSFTEGENLKFTGLPTFAPEILRRISQVNTSKIKQLRAALEDLAEEGLVQVFRPRIGSQWVVGVVGILQLDVLKSRALQEYKIEITFENTPYVTARWLRSDLPDVLQRFVDTNKGQIVTDKEDNPVFLAKSDWEVNYAAEKNEEIEFLKTRELV